MIVMWSILFHSITEGKIALLVYEIERSRKEENTGVVEDINSIWGQSELH